MNKLLIALLAFSVIVTPAMAGNKQYKKPHHGNNNHWNGNHNNNWHGKKRRHGDGHNYWRGKNHNYWHGNNNDNFYNDPNFWGGVAGGLIGGAIINEFNDQPVGPGPGCYIVLQPVEGPNNGVVYREVVLCN